MPTTSSVCPRCHTEVSPGITRCRSCNQTLARPAVSEPVPSRLESDTTTGTLDRGTVGPTSGEKLRVECACGAGIRVGIALRGKRVKCPKCSAAVLVPVLQDSTSTSSSQIAPAIERPSSVPRPKESLSGDSSVVRRSAASSVTSRTADDQTLTQAFEAAATLPVPSDAVQAPQGRLSSRRLRKICNQLESANVLSDADTVARRQSLLELGQSQDSQVLGILVEHSHTPAS